MLKKEGILHPLVFLIVMVVLGGAIYFERGQNTAIVSVVTFASFWIPVKFLVKPKAWHLVAYFGILVFLYVIEALILAALTLFFFAVLFGFSVLRKLLGRRAR